MSPLERELTIDVIDAIQCPVVPPEIEDECIKKLIDYKEARGMLLDQKDEWNSPEHILKFCNAKRESGERLTSDELLKEREAFAYINGLHS